jgi:uncharacterized membrane protein YbhN (UPF0104 family)
MGGGWRRGLLRVALALVVVCGVVWWSGPGSWAPLLEWRLLPYVLGGSALHLAQRSVRLRKWALLIAPSRLRQLPFTQLLRIQLVGLLANQLLPISEALKVWAVARKPRDVLLASRSLVADMALHSVLIGVVGAIGAALHPLPTLWLAAGLMGGASLLVLLMIHYAAREDDVRLAFTSLSAHGFNLAETVAQVAVYALAAHALGVPLDITQLFALTPILYLTDLVMLTPSGLGLREAVFAVALQLMGGVTQQTAVAMGLVISAMLLVAAVAGGAMAMLIPSRED